MSNKGVVIGISAICVVACVAAVALLSHTGDKGASENSGGDSHVSSSAKAIESMCEPTRFKEECTKSLAKSAGDTSDPKELVKAAFRISKEEVIKALEKSSTIKAAKNDPRSAEGLEICKEVIGYAVDDLERVIDSFGSFTMDNTDDFIEDLRVWTGGAVTYMDVCFDAFENATSDAGVKMRKLFNVSREVTSNALTIITEAKGVLEYLNIPGLDLSALGMTPTPTGGGAGSRRLLGDAAAEIDAAAEGKNTGKGVWVAGEVPAWFSDPKRRIIDIPLGQIKPDAVVAQDGSGQYKTIGEALAKVPAKNENLFVIYIKAGTYKEYVVIEKHQMNVVLVGDGPTKTIITGDKNFAAGVQTFKTSTVSALGDGFMARDIAFENTAGPQGHQAVAMRVVSDFAIFHNCRFDGYQDTLYAVRGRQFYRGCIITGTIDFIFGDAQAVFQKCEMRIRKPLDNQQCMVTAQGRTEPNGPGVFVLQGCTITGEPDFMAVKDKNPGFLGRPWKEYSRTIIMNSAIGQAIAPQGWTPWEGTFALNTLYYAEYQNKGPGADTTKRVKWGGIKTLQEEDAVSFTPGKLFSNGDKWIPTSGVPYVPGLISA